MHEMCIRDSINIDVTARVIRVSYDCIEKKNEEVELGNLQDDYFLSLIHILGMQDKEEQK